MRHYRTVVACLLVALAAPAALAQPAVELLDERLLRPVEGGDGVVVDNHYSSRVSPDGRAAFYFLSKPAEADVPADTSRGRLVLRILRPGAGGARTPRPAGRGPAAAATTAPAGDAGREILLDFPPTSVGHANSIVFSPSGDQFIVPDVTRPEPPGGNKLWPLLLGRTDTGALRHTNIRADPRYAQFDATGRFLVILGGEVYALPTGKRAPRQHFSGIVESSNLVWDLRKDALIAKLPLNPDDPYHSDVDPAWTSDGTYLYFRDLAAGAPAQGGDLVVRVWNAKTGQAEPHTAVRRASIVAPGPRAGTMILRQHREGADDLWLLHDAKTGTSAPLPVGPEVRVMNAGGDAVLYTREVDGTRHLFAATIRWGK